MSTLEPSSIRPTCLATLVNRRPQSGKQRVGHRPFTLSPLRRRLPASNPRPTRLLLPLEHPLHRTVISHSRRHHHSRGLRGHLFQKNRSLWTRGGNRVRISNTQHLSHVTMVCSFCLRYASDSFADYNVLTDLLPPAFISTQRRVSIPKQDVRSTNTANFNKRTGNAPEVLFFSTLFLSMSLVYRLLTRRSPWLKDPALLIQHRHTIQRAKKIC